MSSAVDQSPARVSEVKASALAWGDFPPEVRAQELANLIAWVEKTLRPGWPVQCERLLSCFPAHVDITDDLRGLMILWEGAAVPEVNKKTRKVDPARVERLLGWAREELGPASGRWIASQSACRGNDGCQRSRPDPSKTEDDVKWVADCRAEGARAVGIELPPPGPYLEPWEIAAAWRDSLLASGGPNSAHEALESVEEAGPPPETW